MTATTHLHHHGDQAVSREDLVALLNDDLAGEFQAIISYVIYSQVLKGPQYMTIAAELEKHAAEELAHALIIAQQIDYLGGMPLAVPKHVETSAQAEDMLQFDLHNENETIRHYRQRVGQCEALGEYAVAEHIRNILVQEQDHQIALASALGVETPNVQQTMQTLNTIPKAPQKAASVNRNGPLANAVDTEIRRTANRAEPQIRGFVVANAAEAEIPGLQ